MLLRNRASSLPICSIPRQQRGLPFLAQCHLTKNRARALPGTAALPPAAPHNAAHDLQPATTSQPVPQSTPAVDPSDEVEQVAIVQLRRADPKPSANPSLWDFHTMYAQLEEWHRLYHSTVVPRYVFDNPDLGQWVCHLRRAAKLERLQKWQITMLGRLRFNYKPTRAEGEWHHFYHELRRLMGTASSLRHLQHIQHRDDVSRVLGWLEKQERQLEKGNLSHHQLAMLRRLGVELRVDHEQVAKYEQLDGLTARERRLLRQKWKKERLRQREAERVAAGQPPRQLVREPRRPSTGKRSLGRG